jgi:hypothetical protein
MSNELSACLRKAVRLETKILLANQRDFLGDWQLTLEAKKEAPVTRGFLKDVADQIT